VLLPDPVIAAGYRLVSLEATGSTNEDAQALAQDGDAGPTWVVARSQSAGRGRHGRTWHSPEGNLFASLLLVDPCPVGSASQLGFVAGLALHDAVRRFIGPEASVALKWPNDLLVDGRKAAGLLLEGRTLRGGALSLVIGIGVNVVYAPSDAPYPTAALREFAGEIDRASLFAVLAEAWVARYDAWRRLGLGPILAAWRDRAAGLGETVSIRLPDGEKRGRFSGLDHSGRLILDTPTDKLTVDAGDLFLQHHFDSGASGSERR
jgi:BirA family biotin operon repressor/biotin-[acetyl-CoA-carboxylase] ligase